MITSVNGTTSFSFFVARSRYSNCPDQVIEYPGGNCDALRNQLLRLRHIGPKIASADVDIDPAIEPSILASDLRRPVGDDEIGDGAERRGRARVR